MSDAVWRTASEPSFSPPGPAAGPAPAPGGSPIYFHSTPRQAGEGTSEEWKIHAATLAGGRWIHERLPAPVSSGGRECCVAPAGPGVFYFSSDREGAWEIFRARAEGPERWSVERLPAGVNASKSGQWPSQVTPDERRLLFSSIRSEGLGGDDVYAAFRCGGTWTTPRLLPAPVNSPGYEDGARSSPDGRRLFWSSTRPLPTGDRSSNVYTIEVGDLLSPPDTPSCRLDPR
jgi:hypothetical protein